MVIGFGLASVFQNVDICISANESNCENNWFLLRNTLYPFDSIYIEMAMVYLHMESNVICKLVFWWVIPMWEPSSAIWIELRKRKSEVHSGSNQIINTAQKMKFSIKYFSSKCGQIRRKLQIWSHLLKKSLMENFIFCAV